MKIDPSKTYRTRVGQAVTDLHPRSLSSERLSTEFYKFLGEVEGEGYFYFSDGGKVFESNEPDSHDLVEVQNDIPPSLVDKIKANLAYGPWGAPDLSLSDLTVSALEVMRMIKDRFGDTDLYQRAAVAILPTIVAQKEWRELGPERCALIAREYAGALLIVLGVIAPTMPKEATLSEESINVQGGGKST